MESSRDDNLAATLSSLRPTPQPAFAAELDERAAAGFPRRSDVSSSPLSWTKAHLAGMSPRRVLLPACGTALAALAIATAIVATNDSGSSSTFEQSVAAKSSGQESGGSTSEQRLAKPHSQPQIEQAFEAAAPAVRTSGANGAAGAASAGSVGVEEMKYKPEAAVPLAATAEELPATAKRETGPYASQTNHRDVERSAEMILGAEPADVGDDAAQVFDAVHSVDGIVLRSSTSGGPAGHAGAEFELLIPSARLGDALAAFSGIAEVRSRHEATNDITAPTVSLGEHLQDSNAKIEGLLNDLAGTETEAERDAVEAQLRTARRQAAFLRSQLSNLQRRASFSRVSLQIKTGDSSSPSSSGGGWNIGDAFHDAGHILAIAAGVAIVGLAILGPLALIALLIWLANRAWISRGRRRALG
jgi:Domain of unknown function (DUF4349)